MCILLLYLKSQMQSIHGKAESIKLPAFFVARTALLSFVTASVNFFAWIWQDYLVCYRSLQRGMFSDRTILEVIHAPFQGLFFLCLVRQIYDKSRSHSYCTCNFNPIIIAMLLITIILNNINRFLRFFIAGNLL